MSASERPFAHDPFGSRRAFAGSDIIHTLEGIHPENMAALFYPTAMPCALIIAACLGAGLTAPSGKELLAALSQGETATAQRLIKRGAPVNAADGLDSGALMYAAIYSDLDTMRLLLDKGADPNHADQSGSTALMWSIPDEDKVRLLVARGANVNAVSSLTGRTALLIAAGRPGAARIVKLLLDRGADPLARDKSGVTTVMRAAFNGDPESMKMLIARGVDVNVRVDYGTALTDAVNRHRPDLVEVLLASGADPSPRADQIDALTNATSYANTKIFRSLIAKGAVAKYTNIFGGNLMMAAAASDTSTAEVIGELVKLGADPASKTTNLHITHGYGTRPESALDWASRQGDTPVTRLLSSLTGEKPRSDLPDNSTHLGATTPRDAIAKTLPTLYGGSREFFKRSGCASCHHNILPALAFAQVRAKGIELSRDGVRQNYLQLEAWLDGNREGLFQDIGLPGGDTTAGYLLWGLKAEGHERDRATDALVLQLAGSQALDGGWQVRADRPPIESGRVTPTAVAIRALGAYPIPGRRQEFDARILRAAHWLAEYQPRTGEEKAMRLLGLAWAGGNAPLVRAAAAKLISDQRTDGGWAQLDTLPSDSYATGQALYALHAAGNLPQTSLDKAVRFLLQTQLADGTWQVRSRAFPLQPNYFETGFPHGRDQWISAAGTSWACIGLTLAVEPRTTVALSPGKRANR